MRKPHHASSPDTRERLIQAAGEVFAEKGLHGALIRDITRRAGANIASVNYHFRDKFGLYSVVLRRAHDSVVAAANRPLTATTPESRVRQLLSAMLTTSLDPKRPKWQTRLLARELVQPTPALDMMNAHMRPPSQRLWEAFQEMRPDLSEQQLLFAVSSVVAQSVFHVYHGHLLRRMFPSVPRPDLESLIEHIVDSSLASLRGLQAAPASTRRGRTDRKRRTVGDRSSRTGKHTSRRSAK